VVPFSPGGGYDLYARLIANAMANNLKCTVIVVNKPDAGGLVAINDLYDSPRTDGLTIAVAPEGLALAQIMKAPGVRYDCRKFGWLGSINQDVRFLAVANDSPHKSIADLKKLKPPKAATTEVTAPAGPALAIAIEALNMENTRIVAGYPGSSEVILAVRRGEADFSVRATAHLVGKNVFLRPLVVIDKKRAPEFPDIPAITEFDIKPEAKRMMEIVMSGKASERSLITPPGVSSEKIIFLRKLARTCFQDPDLLKTAKKMALPISPLTGEDAERGVNNILKLTPGEIEKLRYVIFEKYVR
jgi:tripartite-type tricarboxylate transporter receptor subunit TctC